MPPSRTGTRSEALAQTDASRTPSRRLKAASERSVPAAVDNPYRKPKPVQIGTSKSDKNAKPATLPKKASSKPRSSKRISKDAVDDPPKEVVPKKSKKKKVSTTKTMGKDNPNKTEDSNTKQTKQRKTSLAPGSPAEVVKDASNSKGKPPNPSKRRSDASDKMASSNEEKDLDTREHAQAIRQRQLDGCKNLNMLEQQTVAPTKSVEHT